MVLLVLAASFGTPVAGASATGTSAVESDATTTKSQGSATAPAQSSRREPERPGLWIDDATARRLGELVWLNEGRGKPEFLMWWNEGEAFASLGIGHFIWDPTPWKGRFEESFPPLLEFLKTRGHPIPEWLTVHADPRCPWPTREAFFAARNTPPFVELRRLLETSVSDQARFIAARLPVAYDRMMEALPPAERLSVATQFVLLRRSAGGLYALVDYLNFKGDGTRESERYRGQGWGLLQVLQTMSRESRALPATAAFARAAERVLERRVRNAPSAREEARWLPGWRKRVRGYHQAHDNDSNERVRVRSER